MKEEEYLQLQQAMRAFSEKHGGRFTAEMLVEEARANPTGPFYKYFEWDIAKAAWNYWVDQARALIRSIRVDIVIEDKEYRLAEFVHDPEVKRGHQGYVAVRKLRQEPANAESVILNEFSMAAAFLDRARGLSAYLGVEKPTERAQEAVKRAARAVGQKTKRKAK
jgi:DNA-binding NarL/FixJ family response regulator